MSEIRGSDDYSMLDAPSTTEFRIAFNRIAIVEQLHREHRTPGNTFFPIPDGEHVGFRIRIGFLREFVIGFIVLDVQELTQRGFTATDA